MSLADIKKLLDNKKLLIGADRVLKNMRINKIEKVFVSSNCRDDILNDIKHFASINDASVEELTIPNDEMGAICKKTFSVSVIGLLK
ncbi:hypothetical protein CMO90_02110 [Candidatus Woesearchaeota archaeon]|jgi:ribosomal protein L30E|nr:hypothetical protein [Candidatus Woesearchaeota archaeon]